MDHGEASGDRGGIIVIGAGPSGLAAGLRLRRAGLDPLVLERTSGVGGLMRSLRWRDFTVDLGRKELYARFPEVDALWTEALGDEYRPYPHRVGSLYRGRIIEMSGRYRGPLRGMPPALLARGAAGLAAAWANAVLRPPRTLADHWYARVGRPFARAMAQGYWEKFRGVAWTKMPPPESGGAGARRSLSAIGDAVRVARLGGRSAQRVWHHPRRGTGQLFEALAQNYENAGGRMALDAEVTRMEPRADGRMQVTWREGGRERTTPADHVVSSLSIERLWSLLGNGEAVAPTPPVAQRSVLLVYLFLDGPPRFPHAWLEVNDPQLSCGRVTSFAAFGGDMVPEGKAALCVEFFCSADDPLLSLSEPEQVGRAIAEVESAALVDRGDLLGSVVVHLPRTNAAASWREQQDERRAVLFEQLAAFPALYHANRPGSDWATLVGMQAARAIIDGDRATFDRTANPMRRQEDRIDEHPDARPRSAPARERRPSPVG